MTVFLWSVVVGVVVAATAHVIWRVFFARDAIERDCAEARKWNREREARERRGNRGRS